MKISIEKPNSSLISIFEDPGQIITLDANFLIPPNRKQVRRGFEFLQFREIWLDPIFSAFPRLAIHEAVYEELIQPSVHDFIQQLLKQKPSGIILHKDAGLTAAEKVLRASIEDKIYPYTKYDPKINNKDDRGEVKSLSYIAVKGLLYFAAHDYNAIQLIEKAEAWSTGLDNVHAIQMYELIYYLYANELGKIKSLRLLYKYQYHLTEREKTSNPEWGVFIVQMNELYQDCKCKVMKNDDDLQAK
jgi:hypothetical protein